ncbi:MAG TPA: YrdB family protein [Rubrobacter sp.]|nr:YrdB family protein [Rubrobacter sp.]
MLTLAKPANLAVRFLLELCALGALVYWGFAVGGNLVAKLALGLGAPLLAAAVWGTFVAPKAAFPLDMPLRLVPEALVFGSAVAALFATGHPLLAVCLAVLAAVNRALVLAWE